MTQSIIDHLSQRCPDCAFVHQGIVLRRALLVVLMDIVRPTQGLIVRLFQNTHGQVKSLRNVFLMVDDLVDSGGISFWHRRLQIGHFLGTRLNRLVFSVGKWLCLDNFKGVFGLLLLVTL